MLVLLLAGCGRIGIDEIENQNQAADAANDAPRVCPADTVAISDSSFVCIEKAERGNMTWTAAKATCEALGRRLCADAEWATGCDQATGLIDMFDDGGGATPEWEWVAELVAPGVGGKRGYGLCADTSSHEIFVDPYDFRCCVDI